MLQNGEPCTALSSHTIECYIFIYEFHGTVTELVWVRLPPRKYLMSRLVSVSFGHWASQHELKSMAEHTDTHTDTEEQQQQQSKFTEPLSLHSWKNTNEKHKLLPY